MPFFELAFLVAACDGARNLTYTTERIEAAGGNATLAVVVANLREMAADMRRCSQLLRQIHERYPEGAGTLQEPSAVLSRMFDDTELLMAEFAALRDSTAGNIVWNACVRDFSERVVEERRKAKELVNHLSTIV